ncbi:tetratricopeptide repeat protein [Occallatibacter riparius]|uniref:Tetratricopeptide repeat protein n=1 Tax=Occallatibacter riparius TaxID=1002689 RepID=A0A9J7BU77_9BACT|nr:tetratricopeptide repeat protein [Occallatibacter riparius]UWZ86192.1 tetratricopeptide repeat protein [Occallatibacter riparius]
MGYLTGLFYPWGLVLQVAAIIHFIRRRPDTYWLYIVLFLGPVGALVYIAVEVVPDASLLGGSFKAFPRRKRIGRLKLEIHDNPSAGNYEELADLYREDGKLREAREAYDKAISARSSSLDCFYRRGACTLALGDAATALPDLEMVVSKEPGFDFDRAAGAFAQACAKTGQTEKAEAWFQRSVERSTSSEGYLNFAEFLASQGRGGEARQWVRKVLDKKPTMPGYLRRRERPQFRRAAALLKRLPS